MYLLLNLCIYYFCNSCIIERSMVTNIYCILRRHIIFDYYACFYVFGDLLLFQDMSFAISIL